MKLLSTAGALTSLVLGVSISSAQTAAAAGTDDAAFVVQQGATINGQVDGSLQVLADGGKVQIGLRAAIAGDLIVPPEKTRAGGAANRSGGATKANPASPTRIDNQGGVKSLKGALRAAETFTAPAVVYSGITSATHDVVVKNENETVDFKGLGNLTVDHAKALIVVPPGAYGNFAVSQGTLLLGFGGAREPTRYEFNHLDVGATGRILVAGPVVVTLGGGGTWRGRLGDEANLFWLDLRVATGDVTLGAGATFNGFLSAPTSLVTVGSSAVFKGQLVASQLTVEDKATASVVSPVWTAGKGQGNGPAFAHRALRFQRELPDLQRRLRGQSSAAVAYPGDFPFVMLSGKRTSDNDLAATHERNSLLEAFYALLGDTGFERAGVVLTVPADDATTAKGSVRNVILTAGQFEQVLQELGGKSSMDENVRTIRASSDLLERFMTRTLALGLVPIRGQ